MPLETYSACKYLSVHKLYYSIFFQEHKWLKAKKNVRESKVISNYIKNFPFTTLRHRQEDVLRVMDSALASGYKRVILEAPGFGLPIARGIPQCCGVCVCVVEVLALVVFISVFYLRASCSKNMMPVIKV